MSTDPVEHDFRLDVSGRVVRGKWLAPSEGDEPKGGPLPYAILAHGFSSFMQWGFFPLLAERLAQAGVLTCRFDMSGNGVGDDLESFTEREAFARGSYSNELEDLAAVRAHLLADPAIPVDADRCALVGHSRGAGITLIHASERADVRAWVGWGSIVEAASWTPEKKERWRRDGELVVARGLEPIALDVSILLDAERNRDRFDVHAAARRFTAPALLVHGERDIGVTVEAVRSLHEAFPEGSARLEVIPGVGHNLGARHPLRRVPPGLEQAIELTVEAVAQALIPGSGPGHDRAPGS